MEENVKVVSAYMQDGILHVQTVSCGILDTGAITVTSYNRDGNERCMSITECLEEFKSRTARDELPGEG
jgi:hypothetical protein